MPSAGSGGRRVTLTRIAEELGVSAMTVSNAYQSPDQLSEALRERIFQTAERLGYAGPDPVARSLRRQRTDVVGVLYSSPLTYAFEDPAAVSFLSGFSAVTEAAGLGLLLVPAFGGSPLGERGSQPAAQAAVDGFVVYSMAIDEPLLEAALRRGLPMVCVDQPYRDDLPFVGIDDEGAAREAAEHLLGLGHRRFAVASFGLSPDGYEGPVDDSRQQSATLCVTRERLAGYRAVLEAAGIRWEEVPVYECPGSTKELGRKAGRHLLRDERPPTALLALSDQLAFGVIEAAAERGLRVPDDLSVVGFDDVPTVNPRLLLTTVHQDHAQKGTVAGRMLLRGLRGEAESEGEPEKQRLPVHLVTRESSTVPREH